MILQKVTKNLINSCLFFLSNTKKDILDPTGRASAVYPSEHALVPDLSLGRGKTSQIILEKVKKKYPDVVLPDTPSPERKTPLKQC